MPKGFIHIYTGEGKGKTTSALGLAVRAAGQGLRVCIVQFLKGGNRGTGEQKLIEERVPEIEFIISDAIHPMFLKTKPLISQLESACRETFELSIEKVSSGDYDMLILDEINNVIAQGWLDGGLVVDFLESRPEGLEVVLTGRDAPPQIQSMADYVTEMLKIKHPYDEGVIARRGIDY